MAPAKGNKHAVGHGRPPNPGFSDDEIIQLGKDLLDWMEKNKDNNEVIHLSEFYNDVKEINYSRWKSLCERECFRVYYERAREWMGRKMIRNGDFPQSYGNRFLGIYFTEIRENEREIVEHKIDHEIKKKKEADLSASYPNDKMNDIEIAWIKAQKAIEDRDNKIKELEEKLLASQPKAD